MNYASIRAAAILTDAYVAGTILNECDSYNKLVLHCFFTKGSLTDAQIKVEFSYDGTNYVQETSGAISSGVQTDTLLVHKLNDTGNFEIKIPLDARCVKVSAIGTGTVTNSSLKINALLTNLNS